MSHIDRLEVTHVARCTRLAEIARQIYCVMNADGTNQVSLTSLPGESGSAAWGWTSDSGIGEQTTEPRSVAGFLAAPPITETVYGFVLQHLDRGARLH